MSLIRRRSPVVVDGDRTRPSMRTGGARTAARRLVQGVLVVAAGTAALSLAGPFALRPFTDVAGAAGTVTVAFVLDFGGASTNQVVGCVTVPTSDTRYDALSAFTQSRGLGAATYAPSGLLCSINGTPATGCGQVVPGGYVYWSYFTGGNGAWTYASTGASGTVTPGDVEGWRFQDPGTGRPNDPAPRTTATFASICATTTTTTTTTAPGSRAGSGATGGSVGAGSRAARSHRAKQAAGPTAAAGAAGGAGGSGGSTTTSSTASSPDTTSSLPVTTIPPDPVVGVASIARPAPPGAGPDPIIVGGLIAALLAAAAWVRWRRRPRIP